MKLSEYILHKYEQGSAALSIDDVDIWIVEWYRHEFHKAPPMWLTRGSDVKV